MFLQSRLLRIPAMLMISLFIVGIVLAQGNLDTTHQELLKYKTQYEQSLAQWQQSHSANDADAVLKSTTQLLGELEYASRGQLSGTLEQQLQQAQSIQQQAKQLQRMYTQVQVETMKQYVGEMKYLVNDGMQVALIRGDQGQIDTLQRAQGEFDRWSQQVVDVARNIEQRNWSMSEQNRLDFRGLQQTLADAHDTLITQAPSFTDIFSKMRVLDVQGNVSNPINPNFVQEIRARYEAEQYQKEQERRRLEEEERLRRESNPVSNVPDGAGGTPSTESR